jgi:hypothetical protein
MTEGEINRGVDFWKEQAAPGGQNPVYSCLSPSTSASNWTAKSLFHHRPDETLKPDTKVETAYHNADQAIEQVFDLLAEQVARHLSCQYFSHGIHF